MNARSMRGKMVDIKECLYDIDICCVCETWMNDANDNSDIEWCNYQIHRLDRESDRAGGLVTYVKNEHANYAKVIEEASYINDNIEVLTVLIDRPMRRRKLICNVYRPHGGDRKLFVDKLDEILELCGGGCDVWIGGDYNIDYSKQGDKKFEELKGFIAGHNFKILINKITRPESGTIIDNILSNAEDIIYSNPIPDLISDHLPVISVQKKGKFQLVETTFTGRSYKRYNAGDLEDRLLFYDWHGFYREKDPSKQWDELVKVIDKYLDEVCPITTKTVKGRDVDWATPEIRETIIDRRSHVIKFLRYNDFQEFLLAKVVGFVKVF